MRLRVFPGLLAVAVLWGIESPAVELTSAQIAQLPPAAGHTINFGKEIKPLFEASCIKCHARGKEKGGLRMDTRETFMKGGDSGVAIVPGKSSESLLIKLVQGFDPDEVMPKKGSRLTAEQVGLLRAWIDQGAVWDPEITFARLPPANMKPHRPDLAGVPKNGNPIDNILQAYRAAHHLKNFHLVDDRVFARRAYLDVIGLLPNPVELETFIADRRADKRERLVAMLLSEDKEYAQHWLTFWNDLLRNDYKGTGYIDGGRKQITPWLFSALVTNMPFNQFVSQLVDPNSESEGFAKGFVWRGVVNASQTPQMQAAQNISQVFMGVNLKCASCHDSFINDLTLADSYGLAGLYADGPLEMVLCDKPLGKKAALKFLYPELGEIGAGLDKPARLKRLAEVITERQDGRLTRTFVNRVWQRFFGRGLVEPVDDMEKAAWNPDLLDWLAEDFADHHYDVKHLIHGILTSRAYQSMPVDLGENAGEYVFQGPSVRRMTAEQFRDALTLLTDVGYSKPAAELVPSEQDQKKYAVAVPVRWIWNDPKAAEKAKPGHVFFRKTFALPAVPSDATAAVVCDNSFTLYLNGHRMGAGNEFKKAYLFDLKPWLKTGENVFAVDAVNHLSDNSIPKTGQDVTGSENPAGLMVYARIRVMKGSVESTNDLATDKTWVCRETQEKGWEQSKFEARDWVAASDLGDMGMEPWRVTKVYVLTQLAGHYSGTTRASLVAADSLQTALGRPNRDVVVTTRPVAATTLQALELTNGQTLSELLKRGANNLVKQPGLDERELIQKVYTQALGRKPSGAEEKLASEMVGKPLAPAGVEDFLWAMTMLPEFQLIY